jgi:hypothetical protein
VQNGNVVAQRGGFTHHKAGGVVEHQAVAEAGGGVDVGAEHFR